MPTAEATLLAACARAMREERERYVVRADMAWADITPRVFNLDTGGLAFQAATEDECRAYIDQRAFAAGLRVLMESEATEAMVEAWAHSFTPINPPSARAAGDLRAMLGALLAGGDDADVA